MTSSAAVGILLLRGESDEELQRIAAFGLNAVTGGYKVPLMTVMRELTEGTIKQARVVVEISSTISRPMPVSPRATRTR